MTMAFLPSGHGVIFTGIASVNIFKPINITPREAILYYIFVYFIICFINFQLYDQTGRELCIVSVDVNKMCALYYHVKTTPDMSITQAAYMSMSIPGINTS